MKNLLYLFTILLLLCTSCKTKQTLQEFSEQTDSTKTECSTKKEVSKEERRTSSQMAVSDTTSTTFEEDEFTIKFDSAGKPTKFHGKIKKWVQQKKSEKNNSLNQDFAANKLSCDSDFVMADLNHSKYNKIMKPEKKSSKNVLFSVILSLLTFIICHLVLKQKIKRKKLGA